MGKNWKEDKIIHRPDGSFVIMNNSLPFHVFDGDDYREIWTRVKEYAEQNPDKIEEERLEIEEPGRARIAAIKLRLREIDLESIRPLRAKAAGTATAEDEAKYAALEAEAESLRAELAGLKG